MSEQAVLTERNGSIFTLTFNRPKARNAANVEMFEAFNQALIDAESDEIRCVVIRGAEGHFMAGGDLRLFATVTDTPVDQRHEKLKGLNQDFPGKLSFYWIVREKGL